LGGGAVADGRGPEIGDIKVKITVAIDVGQSHGHGPGVGGHTGGGGKVGETTPAVVLEHSSAAPERVHEEIQVAVAIDIGKGRPGRVLSLAGHTGGMGDVLEAPVAQIAVKRVARIETAEVEIAPAIAIDIPGGDAGATEEVAVGDGAFVAEQVGEGDAGGDDGDGRKADLRLEGQGHRRAAISGVLFPGGRRGQMETQTQRDQGGDASEPD
jgi:hypothetical protein